jgi:hypothetical protein
MRRTLPLALISSAMLAAGCGGGDSEQSSGGGGGGNGTATPEAAGGSTSTPSGGGASTTAASGKELFSGTCGSCHTLADAGTSGTFGPNLDEIKPSKKLVLATIKAGPGPMPANLYTGQQADKVATYVSKVAGNG